MVMVPAFMAGRIVGKCTRARLCRSFAGERYRRKIFTGVAGHFDIRTTLRYLHVATKDMVNIKSPVDDLFKDGGLEG